MSILRHVLWISLASLAVPAFAAEWQIVHQQSVIAPGGPSYSQDLLVQSAEPIMAVKVEMLDDGALCGVTTSSIDVTHNSAMRYYKKYHPNAEGIFVFDEPGLEWIVFHNENPRSTRAYCRRVVYVKTGSVNPPPANDFELAGAVQFQGGFRNRIELPVGTDRKVEALWIRVPEFCAGLDVLEAGTITEGFYDSANLIDDENLIFEVNGGAGTRISAVALTLNGPRDLDCDIPVFIRTAD